MRLTVSRDLIHRLVLGLVFGFVVVLVLIFAGDVRQVSARVLGFQWRLFPPVLGLTLFNYTLRFFKWHYYVRQIGVEDLPLPESARLFVASFPLSVTPGKVGEALKAVWLNQAAGVQVARGVSVVLAERISDGLAMVALSSLGVIAYPQYWPALAGALAFLSAIVVASQIRPVALAILGFGERVPLVKRFARSLHEFYEGSFALFRPGPTLLAVALSTVSWLGEGIGFYVILRGLGVSAGIEVLSVVVFVLSFSTIIGAISTLPGGLGAAEASIAGMLVVLLGLGSDTAAAATLLIRFATLWFGVALGLATWSISPHLLGMPE